jgi:hypothetical protein
VLAQLFVYEPPRRDRFSGRCESLFVGAEQDLDYQPDTTMTNSRQVSEFNGKGNLYEIERQAGRFFDARR